ncbi:periplasmic [NiFeSe] hydrogenase large subunit [Clostridium polyendosporum]|uniref:Periplasmic [NiFeSe] hydrogenase large subunit n=1 Tax=Clostridium polyendosporum TaxID=69208 RepID=A0A919VFQ7_9CLOT|nr:nickel-dependent hydrogenase large subunit [Clostridium polyendosporum]GIM27736.1 periplasmic [NiFeSe] hydrogenase large subunit [Clostridium polyendosporum]
MATKIKIDPVTRLEGHLKIEVEIDSTNKVISAYSTGNMFRGFEKILIGRDPRDSIHITQRICGLCPVSHSIAAVKAVEDSFKYTPSFNAKLLRNLIQGGNYLSDHILHFYHLALLDYVKGPAKSPWTPGYSGDYRLTDAENQALIDNYLKALEIRRKAHEMTAIFSGKIPHVMSIVPGGVTKQPTSTDINKFKTYLNEITTFIDNQYMNDLNFIANKYSDYYNIGKGCGNLLTYGVFDIDTNGNNLFKSGIYINGSYYSMDLTKIKEYAKYSWYTDASGNLHPSVGKTEPSYGKTGAYSWLKAPRYDGQVFEVGPLARMFMNKEYTRGISVMDRHMARGLETKKLAQQMLTWIDGVSTSTNPYKQLPLPTSGTGVGLTEAPRGALGHWLNFSNKALTNYQVLTPTCWNVSPRDDMSQMGALEQALIGVTIQDINQPIELLRIVHSFDPCTGCSVHVIDPEKNLKAKFVVSTPNPNGVL